MSGSPPSTENRYARAEALIADLIERQERGERFDLEGCIAANADFENELRELGQQLDLVNRGFDAESQRTASERAEIDQLLSAVTSKDRFSDRYAIEAEVGKGGMGIVYRVLDRKLDRPLALKVIRGKSSALPAGQTPALAPRQIARFLNEARITGQLDHPGIVPVHEVGVDHEGRAYFTMKLVKGRTLGDVLELRALGDEHWSLPRVLGLFQRVCEAMAFAHEHGVIHRDLKPANVMVGDFGEVYVMDWGLARRIGDGEAPEEVASRAAIDEELSPQATLTRDGDQVGTPAYMSPEQARGEIARMGPWSDVYSIGAMLYELISGAPPYVKKEERSSGALILTRVIAGPPKELVSPVTPPELLAICHKAIERDPERRYASVRELAEDVDRFLAGRSVKAFKTGAWIDLQKWVNRNKALASSLAAALLLLVAGLTASLIFKSHSDENARVATKKANDVLSLSAIQDLKELEERADKLWPAYPEMVPAYEKWLEDARVLIEGRPAGEGRSAKPSLAQHEASLEALRRHAKPLTPEQIAADRRASPSLAEWEKAIAELTCIRRMLGREPWPSEEEVEAEVAQEQLPADKNDLHAYALTFLDTAVFGSEVKGLVLARKALAAADRSDLSGVRDTLAWALFRCGRLDEALTEEEHAVGLAIGEHKQKLIARLQQMRERASSWWAPDAAWETGGVRHPSRNAQLSMVAARVAELESKLRVRRTFNFDDPQDGWWHAQLEQLVSCLRAFTDEEVDGLYSAGISEEHGWGVVKRAEFARTIAERSVNGPVAKLRWDEAIAAIAASPIYGGLMLERQVGMLPIDTDPASGLWEFWYVQSGEEPRRGADRKLILTEKMGLVLVLIPGGTFTLGAQGKDAKQPNYDPHARDTETPYQVKLDSYFLSKYEMTQWQWEEFVGRNPSLFGPHYWGTDYDRKESAWSALQPVTQVSWNECVRVLWQLGLSLPTEAQWEHGCRGSTSTPYWTGSYESSLEGAANLADQCAEEYGLHSESFVVWDDGHAVHTEVGSFRANELGLHDTHGNVWEWCLDTFSDGRKFRPGDGERVVIAPESPYRAIRGGGYDSSARRARTSNRNFGPSDTTAGGLGVRPARAVRLSTPDCQSR